MNYDELKAASEALEAYKAEKADTLNTGRTFTEMDRAAYKARRHYLGLVYYDNNHRTILALLAENAKLREEMTSIKTLSNPSPYRTLGEASDNLSAVNDHARAALGDKT
jgi:hypothetical protein